jgi:Skp family chaperone for outer membrane proteins
MTNDEYVRVIEKLTRLETEVKAIKEWIDKYEKSIISSISETETQKEWHKSNDVQISWSNSALTTLVKKEEERSNRIKGLIWKVAGSIIVAVVLAWVFSK